VCQNCPNFVTTVTLLIEQDPEIRRAGSRRLSRIPHDLPDSPILSRNYFSLSVLAYLLQQALEAGESELTLEMILFSVLRHFDPNDVEAPTFLTIKTDDEQFFIGNFSGDNVLICDYGEERNNEQ